MPLLDLLVTLLFSIRFLAPSPEKQNASNSRCSSGEKICIYLSRRGNFIQAHPSSSASFCLPLRTLNPTSDADAIYLQSETPDRYFSLYMVAPASVHGTTAGTVHNPLLMVCKIGEWVRKPTTLAHPPAYISRFPLVYFFLLKPTKLQSIFFAQTNQVTDYIFARALIVFCYVIHSHRAVVYRRTRRCRWDTARNAVPGVTRRDGKQMLEGNNFISPLSLNYDDPCKLMVDTHRGSIPVVLDCSAFFITVISPVRATNEETTSCVLVDGVFCV